MYFSQLFSAIFVVLTMLDALPVAHLAGVYNPVGVMANVSSCVVGVADIFLEVGVVPGV